MSVLYVVATPIGNLGDISARALTILREVDLIAAEDTRHSRRLLAHYGITTPLHAYHEHNETESAANLIALLSRGQQVALVSDAGTPLVSDPGYRLIRSAIEANIRVSPVPGPSALLAALGVSGLPTDRFCFEGFLPARQKQRESKLKDLVREPRTMVFFEAPHRIRALLADLMSVFGAHREISISRELTKQYEQVWTGVVGGAFDLVSSGDIPEKGEFVVTVKGAPSGGADYDEIELMQILLTELSPATAASLASRILGANRKHLYEVALSLKNG